MNKKYILPIVFLAACGLSTTAQKIGSYIISSGGNDIKADEKHLTYTIGEVMVTTYKKGSNSFTQGFNQPVKLMISSVKDISAAYSFSTFPNPTQDIVNININGNLQEPLELEMFDNKGSRMNPEVIQNDRSKIRFNMQSFPAGYYFVRLVNPSDNTSSTIKIAKIQ